MGPRGERTEAARPSPLKTNPARQAVASLRGYSYQIALTALAWLELADEYAIGDVIVVEGAEDFDRITDADAVIFQVKALSNNLTLRSADVIEVIQNLWDVTRYNDNRKIHFRLLTTARPGTESGNPLGVPGLLFWNDLRDKTEQATHEAGTAKIRHLLRASKFSGGLSEFILDASDDDFFDKVITPIKFETGMLGIDKVESSVRRRLVLRGEKLCIPPKDSDKLLDSVLQEVLRVATLPENRVLDRERLSRLLADRTMRSYPESTIRSLTAATAGSKKLASLYVESLGKWTSREEAWERGFYIQIDTGVVDGQPVKLSKTVAGEDVEAGFKVTLYSPLLQARTPKAYTVRVADEHIREGDSVAIIVAEATGSNMKGIPVALINYSISEGTFIFVNIVWDELYAFQEFAAKAIAIAFSIVNVTCGVILHSTIAYFIALIGFVIMFVLGLILLRRRFNWSSVPQATNRLRQITKTLESDYEQWRTLRRRRESRRS